MRSFRKARPVSMADNNMMPSLKRHSLFQNKGMALFAVLAGLLAVSLILPSAWRATERREAYLPSLEQQAVRTPDDGPLLALVGAGRMAAGENAGAAASIRQALADGESSEDLWRALAANVAATGDRTRAIADLRLGVKALPLATSLQGALAQARISDPNAPPTALAVVIDPQGPAPLRARYAGGSGLNGIAQWWGQHHPEDSGFATRQAWAAARPSDAQAQRLWGEALLRNRRLPEAGAALILSLSLAPHSPAVNLAMAAWEEQSGNTPQAALQYLACLKLRPDWLPALIGFGHASLKNNLTPYALSAFTRAAKIAPNSPDAWIGLGQAQLKTGVAFDHALEAFGQAARLAPNRTDFADDYADALRRSSRASEAEALLRRRLLAVPDDALAHYLLGLVLHDTDPTPARVAEAEVQARESLRLSPHNPLADTLLGQILRDKGQFPAALTLFQEALTQTPYDEKLLLIVAHAYQQAGQPAQAAQITARAQALFADQQRAAVLADQEHKTPLDIDLHRQLAVLYARNGLPAKAQHETDMVRLLQTDPQQAVQSLNALDAQIRSVIPQ
jgi:tetratricopeptide (TPR) repeat protein